jgi:hypothetical protein
MRLGLQREDRFAVDRAVESCKKLFGMREEKIDELGLITTPCALGNPSLTQIGGDH